MATCVRASCGREGGCVGTCIRSRVDVRVAVWGRVLGHQLMCWRLCGDVC